MPHLAHETGSIRWIVRWHINLMERCKSKQAYTVQNNRKTTLAQKLAAMADKRILCVSTTDALSREQRKPRCLRKRHQISQPDIRYWLNKKSCFDAYSSRPTQTDPSYHNGNALIMRDIRMRMRIRLVRDVMLYGELRSFKPYIIFTIWHLYSQVILL